jgi:hypothetical protein
VDAAASGAWLWSQGGLWPVSENSAQTTGEAAYGKAVWFWHPLLVSSRRRNVDPTGFWQSFNPPAMEAKGIRLQGEHGISRQTIAQGMPECSSCTCMLVCVFFALFAHEIAGAASTRHSLRPLLWANEFAKLGRPAARMRRRILLAGAHTLPVTLRRPQRGRLEGRRPPAGAAHPSRLASLAPQDDGAEQLATTPLLQVSSDCASDC